METTSQLYRLNDLKSGNIVLIDVREPNEFSQGRLPGAINMPSSFVDAKDFTPFRQQKIALICQSGRRAEKVQNLLLDNGFEEVGLTDRHMGQLSATDGVVGQIASAWTIDRQFRLLIGMMLAIFLIGYHVLSIYFVVIPAILAAGLIFTSIINNCYMKELIGKLPWNKNRV